MRLFRSAGIGVIAGLVLLAGCGAPATTTSTGASAEASTSTSAAASTQTVAEACNALGLAMTSATSALQTAVTEAASDPAKAADAIDEFSTTLEGAVAEVTNPEIKAEGEKSVEVTDKLAKALEALSKKQSAGNVTKAQKALREFQSVFTDFAKLCS